MAELEVAILELPKKGKLYEMTPHVEVCKGLVAFLLSMSSWAFSNLFPIITTMGALAGSFLAFHGVYLLLHEKYWKKE